MFRAVLNALAFLASPDDGPFILVYTSEVKLTHYVSRGMLYGT
jgi:hypothetical protein